jgi:hypothetical protein
MAGEAVQVGDRVVPNVPLSAVWVLSLPWELRVALADPGESGPVGRDCDGRS